MTKRWRHFGRRFCSWNNKLCLILKYRFSDYIIFQSAKNYYSPTCVTRLKVAPNMADPIRLKGCGMGPRLVLVSPCFRENAVATCKIGSFLCSLDNLLQKNVIVYFFKINFKMALTWKKKWPTFHIFSHQGKVTKIPSAHISLTYIHVFCSPYWLFLALPILKTKNTNLSGMVSLGMIPGVDVYSRHFGTINK